MKAYAGSASVALVSGRSVVIIRLLVKNNRLAAVRFVRAFATIARTGPHPESTTTTDDPTETATLQPCATCSTA